MKDIQLQKVDEIQEKYDWSFDFNDLQTVRGNNQLINAVKHAVLLRPGELIQECYQDKGCPAHEYILQGNTTNGQTQVTRHIESTAKSVDGVYDATAQIQSSTDYDYKVRLQLLTDEMEVVNVDEI